MSSGRCKRVSMDILWLLISLGARTKVTDSRRLQKIADNRTYVYTVLCDLPILFQCPLRAEVGLDKKIEWASIAFVWINILLSSFPMSWIQGRFDYLGKLHWLHTSKRNLKTRKKSYESCKLCHRNCSSISEKSMWHKLSPGIWEWCIQWPTD